MLSAKMNIGRSSVDYREIIYLAERGGFEPRNDIENKQVADSYGHFHTTKSTKSITLWAICLQLHDSREFQNSYLRRNMKKAA